MNQSDFETAKDIVKIACVGSELLEAICKPAAEELGFILRDKLRIWRLRNITPILQEARAMLETRGPLGKLKVRPRIAIKVLGEGSLVEDSDLQKMWAGLLASSCTEDGGDETNLIFVNILAQLSIAQAKIVRLPFIEGDYSAYQHDGSEYTDVEKERSQLITYSGLPNWAILKRELDHLNSLGLVSHSLVSNPQLTLVRLHYDEAALQLYARCQGHTGNLQQFLLSMNNPPA